MHRTVWLIVSSALFFVAGHAVSQQIKISVDRAIPYGETTVGRIDNITVSVGTLTVAAVLLPELFRALDEEMKSRGDLETDHWSRRIYWIGNTKVLSETGKDTERLSLSTRIRYEQWVRLGKFRVGRSTNTVDWRFWIPASAMSDISLHGEITNIRDFPNWLEDLLDVRVSENLKLPLPVECGSCNCQELTQQSGLELSSVTFRRMEDSSINVKIAFRFSGELDVTECWTL
jgi:hypothetical protein